MQHIFKILASQIEMERIIPIVGILNFVWMLYLNKQLRQDRAKGTSKDT
jgi:hypothetical protein